MTRRVVVLGAGAAGLAAANRLARHAAAGADLDVVLVDRGDDHVFLPGLVAVLFGDAEPGELRRPLTELTRPEVRVLAGEVTGVQAAASTVTGSFGELRYDELVVALGAEVGWPDGAPACGDLSPWTPAGALAGREALRGAGPGTRIVVGTSGPGYRCPPAVFDLAARLRTATGFRVDLAHPWPVPLAPFGPGPSAAFSGMLADAGVDFHGDFTVGRVTGAEVVSDSGTALPYDVALLVPPHRPPAAVAASALAGPSGWPAVTFPDFTHPDHRNVTFVGDVAAAALRVGMAGTLAVFEAAHAADRIAAGAPPSAEPKMTAICFVDTGDTGSFLHCDFTGPASGAGPASCVLMPFLPYFRRAKHLFGAEWFTSMLTGEVG